MTIVLLRRIGLPLLVFLAWTPAAYAWSWPVQGPVLQPFAYDESHPYAGGQHRGIDIGAEAAGDTVVAPASGTVSFAGSVPSSGECVTIQTADAYSVTLTHLGSIRVAKGAAVAEGDAVGTIGPSGTPDFDRPYVHLGIRIASDPNGYVDPLRFLPAAVATPPAQSGSTASQPSASGEAPAAPAVAEPVSPAAAAPAAVAQPTAAPASSATPTQSGGTVRARPQAHAARHRPTRAAGEAPAVPRASRSTEWRAQRPVSEGTPVQAAGRSHVRPARSGSHVHLPADPARRVVGEAAAARLPIGLGAGHEPREAPPIAKVIAPEHEQAGLLPLACNGGAALVAVGAALLAARRRRRSASTAWGHVLRLPLPELTLSGERHAA